MEQPRPLTAPGGASVGREPNSQWIPLIRSGFRLRTRTPAKRLKKSLRTDQFLTPSLS